MEILDSLISLYWNYLCPSLFFAFFVLVVVDFIKSTSHSIQIIALFRWVLLIFGSLTILSDSVAYNSGEFNYFELPVHLQIIGVLQSLILPLLLFIPWVKNRKWVSLLLFLGIVFPGFFNSYVIVVTSLHRDYVEVAFPWHRFYPLGIGVVFSSGLISHYFLAREKKN